MRTSSPSLPPSDEERISSEPPEPNDAQPDEIEAATSHEEAASGPATDSIDPRTRETLREPTAAPEKAAAAPVKGVAPPAAKGAEKPVKEVVAEITSPPVPTKGAAFKAEEKATPAPVKLASPTKEPEKPVASSKAPERPVASSKEPEKPVASSKAPERPVVSSKEPEKPVASSKEPEKPVASSKEPVASSKAPVSVAADKPATSEKPTASKPAVKSAKAEAPPSKPGSAPTPPASKKPMKGAEPANSDATKPASKRPGDEELDSLSVSAEFFRREEDSVPPVIDSHGVEDLLPIVQPPSPAVLARRARLRRVVAGVVAFAGVISIAVVGKMVAAAKQTSPTTKPPVVQQDTHKDPQPSPEPPPTAQKVAEAPKPTADPKAADSADPKAADSADPKAAEAKTAEPKAEEPKAEEPKKAEPSADAEALRKETLNLLNRGKLKDAIPKAHEAIAADPTDANGYLYLGSALQDSGHWKDGLEAYCECVRNATKGPVSECRQMGGHK